MPAAAETLFQQFCRTRDPAVLGEVFDRCADDLFAVALHLAADRAVAEDLVQSTFLVAIEREGERGSHIRREGECVVRGCALPSAVPLIDRRANDAIGGGVSMR